MQYLYEHMQYHAVSPEYIFKVNRYSLHYISFHFSKRKPYIMLIEIQPHTFLQSNSSTKLMKKAALPPLCHLYHFTLISTPEELIDPEGNVVREKEYNLE